MAPAAQADFGFRPGPAGFQATARAEGGAPDTLSGSHPYALSLHLTLNPAPDSPGEPGVPHSEGDLRDLRLTLPPGLILNPAAVPQCAATQFNTPRSSSFEAARSGESCPDSSQIGTVDVHTSLGGGAPRRFGLFNLAPAPGISAQLGFAPYGAPIVLGAQLRPDPEGRYSLSLQAANLSQRLDLTGIDLSLWGTPWAASHDAQRGNCLDEAEPDFPWAKCSPGAPATHRPLAYLTMPTDCSAPLAFSATATSWQGGAEALAGYPAPQLQRCNDLRFEPFAAGQLTDRKASSASGFQFNLTDEDTGLTVPAERVRSQVRRATLTLPEGVTINPSLGAGLGVCTPAGYAAETPTSAPGSGCPNAAKIGDFTLATPLVEEALGGAIYLAEPDDPATSAPGAENPFDSLLAVYLVARSQTRGILVKVAGRLTPDPGSGRLTAVFDDLPQLPYSDLQVNFRSGQRAPLITPAACGPAATQIELTPWVGALQSAHAATAWQIEAGIGGGPCPAGAPPFAPGVVAGGVNSNVGSYTPYFVHLTRKDTEQEITSYSLILPKGITGKLAGIPFCPEAAIEAARRASGTAETEDPSCPAASQVGRTLSGYGIGAALTYSPGRVYLAGPYHGSPLSLVTIDAATVGPFDLGTIVIRSAFQVDPLTAQLRIDSAASDPIPHILAGIPLHLREVRVYIDRPEFTRNPTSCEPSQLESTLTGSAPPFTDPETATANLTEFFQLLGCRTLAFKPKLGLRLRGGSRRGQFPSLRATFAARSKDANLERIAVTMPHSEFLAQNHIRAICSRVEFAAENCPADSIYGKAVAYTPLFDQPLRGNLYLRSSAHRLPDLVASLYSGAVHIVLEGEIGPARNGIRAYFSGLPDAPLSRFTMTLNGGERGLLVNSSNLCTTPPIATVKALGQNNIGAIFTTKLRGQCAKSHRHPSRGARR